MAYDAQSRVGDIVIEVPTAMRVFESRGIDYCCGGQRTLAEACARAGQDLQGVLAELEALPASGLTDPADPRLWREAPLRDLIRHIENRHHAFTRSELQRLALLMDKVLRVHGARHPELAEAARCFRAIQDDLVPHLAKEEQILFPYIRQLEIEGAGADSCFSSVQNPIRAMEDEHEEVGKLLEELEAITHGYAVPEDACGSYRSLYLGLHGLEEDLHLHIYLENHILFPRSIALEEAS